MTGRDLTAITTPFNTTVSVMPTPWNAHTKLMHVAIKGYDVKPAEQPQGQPGLPDRRFGLDERAGQIAAAQTVASGCWSASSMAEDTVAIVTYAGNAGTVLNRPRRARKKDPVGDRHAWRLAATAGEAGIRQAYRLAQQSFVKDGVNRVMLATDGDFNVGQTNDDDLKRLIEQAQKGVFLSVFGFGRGNYNDAMMQTLAQNGNGTAAYIDTLAEARKRCWSRMPPRRCSPIAKDVKIQVEFNPPPSPNIA
jgi:Ca-activated chloride channel family protein